jgi:hypothetical protein
MDPATFQEAGLSGLSASENSGTKGEPGNSRLLGQGRTQDQERHTPVR